VDEPKRLPERVPGPNPLPIETVRDLLGIVRVLYAFHRGKGNYGFAKLLQHAGRQLRRALEIAIRKGDTAAHAQAWQYANEAISAIGRVQINSAAAGDLSAAVAVATNRVQARRYSPADREARRAARIKRG
jgi:hypothetical protein